MPDLPDAHVIESQQCFKVRPGVAAVHRSDGFDLRNVTRWWVTLHFPEGVLVPEEHLRAESDLLRRLFPGEVVDLLIGSVRWAGPRDAIHLDFTAEGVHDYAVIVHTDRGPAEADGDSRPKVIVDP